MSGFSPDAESGSEDSLSPDFFSFARFDKAQTDEAEQALHLWRERLKSEAALAQGQWSDMLQSSIDRALQRLAEQLPERARAVARTTEEKMTQQSANLGQMLDQMSFDAQNALGNVKAAIEQELRKARETMESARSQTLERLSTEAEELIAPHAVRIPELVQELSGREEQMAESLQLHRERLRHASDNTLREVVSHIELSVARIRSDFEAARAEAFEKWNRDLDTLSSRADAAVSETISRTSEWLQQETRERIQLLTEQVLTAASARLEEQKAEAAGQFAKHLEGQSLFHLAHVHQQLNGVASDLTGRTRTQLAEAAETAAASFGEVLHDLTARETAHFNESGLTAIGEKAQQFQSSLQRMQATFETDSTELMDTLRQQAAACLQETLGKARAAMAAESHSALIAHRAEREAYAQEWQDRLTRIADQTFAQCNDRMQTAADAWTLASVRRLNEHGQNAVDSLARTADQALHDSASRVFDGLAAVLREHHGKLPGAASYAAAATIPPDQAGA